ncbi:adenylate/guanylate cyclase domain-containing protein [Pedobacter ginsengisoli]|uniref:adenylate/guanylate cyclase domain-containing protein n=1 Tax=Pedobacter ginsengisoli TaxID=363852 RepID=UPI00254DF148|nr:adenylate/guanylate cyclase domain-containing protein [Pedobacter ginsengisoli]
MNRRTNYKLKQLVVIVISWMIVGFVIAIYEHLVLHTHNSLGTVPVYSLTTSVILNMGIALFGALVGGSLLVFYVNVKYHDKPYLYTIAVVTGSFILIILIINVILRYISVSDIHRFEKNGLVWSIIVAITQLMLQINSKFGPGIFWNILSGKYNTPRDETRIFMFLDLNSSTTIAEKLGDKQYHQLLKDFFTDITNPILDNKGEIYQYVGDEVVIAWKYEDGIENSKCIQCFFDIKDHLATHAEKYHSNYGLLPTFKAGIHCGRVVAGEIGIIKRDVTYSGDVLNTTSRIQSMCKQFNEEVIVSADLMDELSFESTFTTQMLGSIKLRGKEKEMSLIAIKPNPYTNP